MFVENIIQTKSKPTSFTAFEFVESSALLHAILFKIEDLKDNFTIYNIIDHSKHLDVMYQISCNDHDIYYKCFNNYISDLSDYMVSDINKIINYFIYTGGFIKDPDFVWEIGTKKYNRSNIFNHMFKSYYFHNKLHREDGPAKEYSNGDKEYYLNGVRHRIDGPAIDYFDKSKEISKAYYINGILHRIDGPAIEYVDGLKQYYINGQLHRTDGPAIESKSINTYYLCGKKYIYEDWLKYKNLLPFF